MNIRYLTLVLLMFSIQIKAQQNYPHILVQESDKAEVLKKIENQKWAKNIYDEMREGVEKYVDKHQTDKTWILSRYLMNRVPGKRYTTVYSDPAGQRLIKWEGDAPFPTVRVNTYLRTPITKNGTSYRKPTIEELVPNDTARLMNLFNPETGQKEWTDPEAYITSINSDINKLAQDAAIIFWITGEEKFAFFAADLLDQWAKGAFYQEPIVGPCRTGFLDMQTLGDASYRPLIVAFDFLKPFMQQKKYDLNYYETVFEKIASTMAFRGFWNNNWYAAESSTLVFAALSIENKKKREYYLQFFLDRDTINGSCGQLALPSTVEKWLTHDGHWKEPGGYHNYPVSNLLVSALALENNGFNIYTRFPQLFRASYAMLKYSFPNLTVSAFGDTGRATQSAESLEIGLLGAIKYNQKELPEMLASMKKLIDGGKYKRENSGYLGLLCFLPEIPDAKIQYEWPRTGTLEFARYFLQRNGTDPNTGLMVGVQGATYNHNHCNGMAMELYGLGEVMGIDAGTGANYEHPMHRNYYSQWAAHNTVVAAGSSSSIPFSGAAGTKQIGQIELVAMEPLPDSVAVSPDFSFTDTKYFDKSTNTNQRRLLSIIRTSPTTGYYVDIYKSDNSISNDYVYHNIGDKVEFIAPDGQILKTEPTSYPVTELDYPGFRFFSDVNILENYNQNLTALFTIQEENNTNKYLQVLIPGDGNKTYFTAFSPKVKTSGDRYKNKQQPLFTMRTKGEAWHNPFIAVFEPFNGKNNETIKSVEKLVSLCSDKNIVLKVINNDGSEQLILQGDDCSTDVKNENLKFSGYFGVISFRNNKLDRIYMGSGGQIGYGLVLLKAENGVFSAELKLLRENEAILKCSTPVYFTIKNTETKEIGFWKEGKEVKLKGTKEGNAMTFLIPKVSNARLIW